MLVEGACGCGIAVVDSNGNGIPDCKGGSELRPVLDLVHAKVTALKAFPAEPTNAQMKKCKNNKTALKNALATLTQFGNSALVTSVQVAGQGISVTAQISGITSDGTKLPKKKSKAFKKAKAALLKKISTLKDALVN